MCRDCTKVLNSAIYSYQNYPKLDASSEFKTKHLGKSLLRTFNSILLKQFSCLLQSYTWAWKSRFLSPHSQQMTQTIQVR